MRCVMSMKGVSVRGASASSDGGDDGGEGGERRRKAGGCKAKSKRSTKRLRCREKAGPTVEFQNLSDLQLLYRLFATSCRVVVCCWQ